MAFIKSYVLIEVHVACTLKETHESSEETSNRIRHLVSFQYFVGREDVASERAEEALLLLNPHEANFLLKPRNLDKNK